MKNLITKIKGSKKVKIGIIATTIILAISVVGIFLVSSNVSAEKLDQVNKNITEALNLISSDIRYMDQELKDELKAIEKKQETAYKSKDIKSLERLEKKIMEFKDRYAQKIILGYQNKLNGLALPEGANEEEKQKLSLIKSEMEKDVNNKNSRLGQIIERLEKAIKDVETLAINVTNRVISESSEVPTNTPSVTKPGAIAPKPIPKPTAPAPVGTYTCYYYVCDSHWDSSAIGIIYPFTSKSMRDGEVSEIRGVPGGWIVRTWEKEVPIGSKCL